MLDKKRKVALFLPTISLSHLSEAFQLLWLVIGKMTLTGKSLDPKQNSVILLLCEVDFKNAGWKTDFEKTL